MSGAETRGSLRPATPDERSHYNESGNPMESTPKFEIGKSAWLKLGGRRGSIEVKIESRQKDEATGKFSYQVKDLDGDLHNKGEWVSQENLDEC
ncbi:hypothetical protein EG329_011521 [Mollisiaceae sp. DMI_Dod_QoI]|nr:hypothetical protein EG329_011521 [Helotiales sp. DMI_Dod_QoI]